MSYLTFNKIKQSNSTLNKQFTMNENAKNLSKYTEKKSVFLSHWHDDKSLVKDAVGFLAQFGSRVYIDWLDNDMPRTTNAQTANLLKQKINVSKKFVVLATPRSIESIWIPWELGVADGTKGLSNIAILPVVQDENSWPEREYYGIYNFIEDRLKGYNLWTVTTPDGKQSPLETWLDS